MTITEPAWAKLNLTLDILGKRPDGYHDLRMVMQSIDLCDMVSITFKERRGITLVTNLNYLPRDNSNIAVKAAELFFQETGIPPVGLTIRVDKHIPVAAGMAGGSSDGAAVLRLLCQTQHFLRRGKNSPSALRALNLISFHRRGYLNSHLIGQNTLDGNAFEVRQRSDHIRLYFLRRISEEIIP